MSPLNGALSGGENFDGQFLPSMGAVLAGQHDAKREPFLIDFGIGTASIPRVSYIDVLHGDQGNAGHAAGQEGHHRRHRA
jgi:hypothetical protein